MYSTIRTLLNELRYVFWLFIAAFYMISLFPALLYAVFELVGWMSLSPTQVLLQNGTFLYIAIVLICVVLGLIFVYIKRFKFSLVFFSLPILEVIVVLIAANYIIPITYRNRLNQNSSMTISTLVMDSSDREILWSSAYVYVLPSIVEEADILFWDKGVLIYQIDDSIEGISEYYESIYHLNGYRLLYSREDTTGVYRLYSYGDGANISHVYLKDICPKIIIDTCFKYPCLQFDGIRYLH